MELVAKVAMIFKVAPIYVRRVFYALVAILVATLLVLTAWQNVHRLPEYVEAFCMHNARRLQEGLPLYVDPAVGAAEHGMPPSRWYVGYAAPYAALLAMLPLHPVWGRSLSLMLFLGTLLYCARRDGKWSALGLVAAAMVLASFRIFQFASSARPDPLALTFAGIAYARTLRNDRVDAFNAAAFGVAMLIKPNVISLAGAAMLYDVVKHRRFIQLVPLCSTLALGAGILHYASKGLWLLHMKAGTAPSLSIELVGDHLVRSCPFIVAPVLLALFAPNPRARLGVVLALAVAMFQFAKLGGAANYLLETCVACVVGAAMIERPMRIVEGLIVTAHMLWSAPIVLCEMKSEVQSRAVHERTLAKIRSLCGSSFVFSSDLGTEWLLNQRIHTIPLELYLKRTPELEARWTQDLQGSTCFVANTWPSMDVTAIIPGRVHYPQAANEWLVANYASTLAENGVVVFKQKPQK